MKLNAIEAVMVAIILIVAALFVSVGCSTSQSRLTTGYELTADFNNIDGIHDGSDVRIAGIKVGSVLQTELDPRTYLAVVKISVGDRFKLPEDTVAEIASPGLQGDKYVSLRPGHLRGDIRPGGKIRYTRSSVSIEQLIGQQIFSPPDEQ